MCLCAEWEQDHIEKIIDGMTEGTRLGGEKKRKKRGETVESIKDGIQKGTQPAFLAFTSNLASFFIARVSSQDNVEQISKAEHLNLKHGSSRM